MERGDKVRQRSIRRLGMDLFLMLFLSVAVILWLVIPFINDPVQKDQEVPEVTGALFLELSWPPGDCDVDLWVWDSNSKTSVGYSNKVSPVFNLLKDDLGKNGDPLGPAINRENVISRKLIDGEYIFNAHLFGIKSCKAPIPVTLTVRAQEGPGQPFRDFFTIRDVLEFPKEEKTLVAFTLYEGKVVPGSRNNLQRSIRQGYEIP